MKKGEEREEERDSALYNPGVILELFSYIAEQTLNLTQSRREEFDCNFVGQLSDCLAIVI